MKWRTGRSNDDEVAADDPPPADAVRMTAWVHGFVQGVGFRWWTRSRALELGLVGSASNLADGRVEVVAEGTREACDELLAQLRGAKTPGGVDKVVAQFGEARGGLRGFTER
jgi:acylphosphatase